MRERKFKEPQVKTATERNTIAFTSETKRILRDEKLFPKRARWQGIYEMSQIVDRFHSCVFFANGIEVESHRLFVIRNAAQDIALAWMYVLNAKMSLALDDFDVNADKLEHWADLYDVTWKHIKGWRNKDRKRYAEEFGDLTEKEEEETTGMVRSIISDIIGYPAEQL